LTIKIADIPHAGIKTSQRHAECVGQFFENSADPLIAMDMLVRVKVCRISSDYPFEDCQLPLDLLSHAAAVILRNHLIQRSPVAVLESPLGEIEM
jgi:hypothetical protein